jgi:hypothetical protein
MRNSIRNSVTRPLILVVCVSTACTSMRPVPVEPAGDGIRAVVHPGDTVRVLTKEGVSETLKLNTVGATTLAGTVVPVPPSVRGSGPEVDVPYGDIEQLAVRRASGAKTTWLIVSAVVVGLGIIVGSAKSQNNIQ